MYAAFAWREAGIACRNRNQTNFRAWLRVFLRPAPAGSLPDALGIALCCLALCACSTNHTIPGLGPSRTASAAARVHLARRFHARPIPALLAAVPEPDCSFKDAPTGARDSGDAERMKLDYERQCYRQEEMILRERLRQLQASTGAGR